MKENNKGFKIVKFGYREISIDDIGRIDMWLKKN